MVRNIQIQPRVRNYSLDMDFDHLHCDLDNLTLHKGQDTSLVLDRNYAKYKYDSFIIIILQTANGIYSNQWPSLSVHILSRPQLLTPLLDLFHTIVIQNSLAHGKSLKNNASKNNTMRA